MASPSIRSFGSVVLSDTGTISTDAGVLIGDVVILFLWSQFTTTATTHTIQPGYTLVRTHSHNDGATCGRLSCATKVATAAGVQAYTPFTIANATAGQTAIGFTVFIGSGVNSTDTSTWIQNSATDTSNAVPNPPSITGLYGDVSVLAIAAWQVTTSGATAAGPPSGYTDLCNGPAAAHLTHLDVGYKQRTALSNATEDPAGFTDNVNPNGTATMTIAIPFVTTFQAATVTDDFNRADNASLGANWTLIDRTMTIASNKAQAGQVQWCSAYWNAAAFNDDHFSEVVAGTITGGSGVGPMVRMKSDFSYYYIYVDGAAVSVAKVVSGAASVTLNSFSQTITTGAVIRLEVQGNVLRAYIAGTLRWSGTDNAIGTGSAGILAYAAGAVTNASLDSFSAGSFPIIPGQPTMRRWGGIQSMLAGNLIGRTW